MKTKISLDLINKILKFIEIYAKKDMRDRLQFFYVENDNPAFMKYEGARLENGTSFSFSTDDRSRPPLYHLHIKNKTDDEAHFCFDCEGNLIKTEIESSLNAKPRNYTNLTVSNNQDSFSINTRLRTWKGHPNIGGDENIAVHLFKKKSTGSRMTAYKEWGTFYEADDIYPNITVCVSSPLEEKPFGSDLSEVVNPVLLAMINSAGSVPVENLSGVINFAKESMASDTKDKKYSYIFVREKYKPHVKNWLKYDDAVAMERMILSHPSAKTTVDLVKMATEDAFPGIFDFIKEELVPEFDSMLASEETPNEEINEAFEKVVVEGDKIPEAYKELLKSRKQN